MGRQTRESYRNARALGRTMAAARACQSLGISNPNRLRPLINRVRELLDDADAMDQRTPLAALYGDDGSIDALRAALAALTEED